MLSVDLIPYTLKFSFAAKTSRSMLRELNIIYVRVSRGSLEGWGECCVLPGLSVDEGIDYSAYDPTILDQIRSLDLDDTTEVMSAVDDIIPQGHRSMKMAIETALLDLQNGVKSENIWK